MPNIQVRGIRQSLPSGYILGRTTAGNGPTELLSLAHIGAQLVAQGAVGSPGGSAGGLPSIASGDVLGNSGSSSAVASGVALTAILDRAFGSTQGSILTRETSSWALLTPGTSGDVLTSGGSGANLSWAAGGSSGGVSSLVNDGTWSGTSAYSVGQIVRYQAGWFVCVATRSAPSGGAEAYNPSSAGANVVLTNSDLTVGISGGTADELVLSTDFQTLGSGAKVYFEHTVTGSLSSGDSAAAVAEITATGPNMGASGTGGVAVFKSGHIFVNGTEKSAGTSFTSGAVICTAIDFTAELYWARVGAAGTWNGSGTANPATGTGGLSLSSLSGNIYVCTVMGHGETATITTNFGASSFTGTLPSGFSSWNSTLSGNPTPIVDTTHWTELATVDSTAFDNAIGATDGDFPMRVSGTWTAVTVLPVASGGTGLAAGTSGGVPYYSATTTITSSGVLAANTLMVGGGAGAAPSTAADWTIASNALIGNLNAAALPTPTNGTNLHLGGADGAACRILLDTFGDTTATSNYTLRAARGTAVSPSALQSGDSLGHLSWYGYGATAYTTISNGVVQAYATENWSDTAQGTAINLQGTRVGHSAESFNIAVFSPEGSALYVPTAVAPYTVSTLPASPVEGSIAYVTDAASPTWHGTLTGGGSTVTPVFYNGSAWIAI